MKRSVSVRVSKWAQIIFIWTVAVVFFAPLCLAVTNSFKPRSEIMASALSLPTSLYLDNFIVAGSFRDTDAFLSRVDKKLFIPVYNFQADNDIIIVKDMAQLPQACNAVFPCTLPLLRTLRIRPDRMPQPG